MKTTFETYELPTHWAPYLINGDSSGLEQEDIDLCDTKTANLGECVGVAEDSYFSRYNGLGCEVSEYTFRTDSIDSIAQAAIAKYPVTLTKLSD